jgi:uncharacterized protein (TIGR03435 family)
LLVAKSGPRLKESRGPIADTERGVAESNGGYKLNNSNLEADGFPRLYPWTNVGVATLNGVIRMRFRDYTMGQLTDYLSNTLGARIKDDTSLGEKYDFTLEFSPPDYGIARIRAVMPTPRDRNLMFINAPDDSQLACAPILSSALEKQSGLRLEAKKVTVDVLVIDHVDKLPIAN